VGILYLLNIGRKYLNQVIEDLENFLEDEFIRLTTKIKPTKKPNIYYIAEVVLIRAKLASFKAKHGYEN